LGRIKIRRNIKLDLNSIRGKQEDLGRIIIRRNIKLDLNSN
jgi:hypothetical protein